MKTIVLLALALAFALPAFGQMRVKVMVVESVDDFQRWMSQKPAPQGEYRSINEVNTPKKLWFPILVTDLRPPEKGVLRLVADAEFTGADGKTLSLAQCCSYTITDLPSLRSVMLGPTPALEFEPSDKPGMYTLRVTVSDGSTEVSTSEQVRFGPASAPRPAPDSIRLQQGTQPAKNPGSDADKRDCLSLPTPAEVIKCTERK